jgi:uncharacterized protein YndB with AHSA1/START domain
MNGTLEQNAAGPRLRFVRQLAHPPHTVWRALTEREQLASWFPQRVVVERWAVGEAVRFEDARVPEATFDGEVRCFDPPRVLEFSWGTDVIRLEVEPHGDGTRLTLLDTIDQLGKAARDGAGWHTCLDRLEHGLDGSAPPWTTSERWRAVHPAYVEQFGAEAASIGPPAGALD